MAAGCIHSWLNFASSTMCVSSQEPATSPAACELSSQEDQAQGEIASAQKPAVRQMHLLLQVFC